MPVIDAQGDVIGPSWPVLAEDAALPAAGPVLLPLARFLATAAADLPRPVGVVLAAEQSPDALVGRLDVLAVVAVGFATFRDGRGFTQARRLRERHGYGGEIRAVGHVLPDQFAALLRCGVTSVDVAQDAAVWRAVLGLRTQAGPLLRRLGVG